MKNPFDRIVGPDGVWMPDATAEDVSPSDGLSAREEFACRCLNAAVNLYGVVSMDEFVRLYNAYAKSHAAPISDEMTVEELDVLVDKLQDPPEPEGRTLDAFFEQPDIWFTTCPRTKNELMPRVIVNYDLTLTDWDFDETPRTPAKSKAHLDEKDRRVIHRIAGTVAKFVKTEPALLPEAEFLDYEEPMFGEDSDAAKKLSKFIRRKYGVSEDEAGLDVVGIQSHIRCKGAKIMRALEYIRDSCSWQPNHYAEFERLVRLLGPVVAETCTWEGRGHSQNELLRMGVLSKCEKEDIYDVFDIVEDDGCADDDQDDGDGGCDDSGDYIRPEDIPLSHYEGPIDFSFVKDPEKREAKLAVCTDVRQVISDYVRMHITSKTTKKARHAAAVRLGFLRKSEKLEMLDTPFVHIVDDFASMLDDQFGEPPVKRALKKKDQLDAVDARVASYYENYRYTWLEVLAVKAGLGVKCRDLLTGEELFLMEAVFSQDDVKGVTVCASIAPMVDVYLALGVIASTRFENSAEQLKRVLTELGLSTELPIRLSFADQARFAAETIRRIRATARFDLTVMEWLGEGEYEQN